MSELATMSQKAIEVLATGNLAKLSDTEKTQHYTAVCNSLGLNPLTRPFEYITLNGKLQLYARKDATDQLRRVYNISISEPQIRFEEDWIIVSVSAKTPDGRTDADVGAVSKKDMQGNFGNSLMKAVTKSKRRVTLSICGLGMLDETEVETIPAAIVHNGTPAVEVPQPLPKQQALPAKAPGGQHQSPVDIPDQADLIVGHETNMREAQSEGELDMAAKLVKADKNLNEESRAHLRKFYTTCNNKLKAATKPVPADNSDIPL